MSYGETTQKKCFDMLLNTFQSFKLIFTSDPNRLEPNFSNIKKKENNIAYVQILHRIVCYNFIVIL